MDLDTQTRYFYWNAEGTLKQLLKEQWPICETAQRQSFAALASMVFNYPCNIHELSTTIRFLMQEIERLLNGANQSRSLKGGRRSELPHWSAPYRHISALSTEVVLAQ